MPASPFWIYGARYIDVMRELLVSQQRLQSGGCDVPMLVGQPRRVRTSSEGFLYGHRRSLAMRAVADARRRPKVVLHVVGLASDEPASRRTLAVRVGALN